MTKRSESLVVRSYGPPGRPVVVLHGGPGAKGHHESWSDMVRLQESGVFPARFASIRCPVLMLHGSYDPHPGALIRGLAGRG